MLALYFLIPEKSSSTLNFNVVSLVTHFSLLKLIGLIDGDIESYVKKYFPPVIDFVIIELSFLFPKTY